MGSEMCIRDRAEIPSGNADIEEGGDLSRIVEKLEKEMRAAAARLDFERAASIRERIIQLQSATN